MIIKHILGRSGSGKTTELLKEAEGNTLFISYETDEEDVLYLAINKGIKLPVGMIYKSAQDTIFETLEESIKLYEAYDTILIDNDSLIRFSKKLLEELDKSGVKKIVMAAQLSLNFGYNSYCRKA